MYDLHINASTVDLNPCHWQWINQCYFWFLSMWLSVACPSKQKMRCYHSAHHPTGSLLQVRGGCCHVALIWPASGEDVECILSAAHTAVPPLSIRTHTLLLAEGELCLWEWVAVKSPPILLRKKMTEPSLSSLSNNQHPLSHAWRWGAATGSISANTDGHRWRWVNFGPFVSSCIRLKLVCTCFSQFYLF